MLMLPTSITDDNNKTVITIQKHKKRVKSETAAHEINAAENRLLAQFVK